MKSIGYPNIFGDNKTSFNIVDDYEATKQNLQLLIGSYKGELLGDPYFGTNLLHILYGQNSAILRDLVIDDIYCAIQTFMPQLTVTRSDITVSGNFNKIWVTINALNNSNYTTNLYNIDLATNYEQQ